MYSSIWIISLNALRLKQGIFSRIQAQRSQPGFPPAPQALNDSQTLLVDRKKIPMDSESGQVLDGQEGVTGFSLRNVGRISHPVQVLPAVGHCAVTRLKKLQGEAIPKGKPRGQWHDLVLLFHGKRSHLFLHRKIISQNSASTPLSFPRVYPWLQSSSALHWKSPKLPARITHWCSQLVNDSAATPR